MYPDDFQVLHMELRGLGRKLAASVTERVGEIDKGIARAFETLTQDGSIQRIIDVAAEKALEEAVKQAFESHDVREAMKRKVVEIIERAK